ncbi:DUF421 domain-containing protein [Thermoflexus sp.]|uniref:DUF421 domain-containing protein n=1 Tax=Thermoflexus sp. TaxID=1969742 RepID=UPI0025F9D5AB|nr:YetF domain-containing protein [Thermoflexus sp.]MDW8179530.1 DUF421 domain-containing protein [Anaerolineae bacterium]MCS6962786.1 DUF421 domain-containing protein [Thermoflexus sp.]MCS7350081.1 DUF421 domain-containing protein [Thermoflexus sp.]MCX7689445.1 DUF421 domain-containing protein [Thermoflexus sp.]MDW8184738.1 DUF421 domain-containing protein [Anaerolineae bacterium]
MLNLMVPAWEIGIRAAAVYLAVLIGLRLSGKREIGQMTLFDLVMLLLLANAVQNAMVGPDTSLSGGILAAGVLLALNVVVAQLRLRWRPLQTLLEGTPTLLVLHGRVMERNLRREGLDPALLEAALREHGLTDVRDVEIAVLEVDGSISVVPAGGTTHRIRHPARFLRRSG